jgi:predicted phage-related endonuclease
MDVDLISATDDELRRTGLGGSDIAAIVHENAYKTTLDVFLSKVEGAEDPETARQRWGKKLEPNVRDEYAETHPQYQLVASPPRYRAPSHDWWLAAPDFLVYESERYLALAGAMVSPVAIAEMRDARTGASYGTGVRPDFFGEVKTHGFHGGQKYGEEEDDIPRQYIIQANWYMYPAKVERTDFAVLIDTHLYRDHYRIYRDDKLCEVLAEAGQDFWHTAVKQRITPAPDGSDSRSKWIRERLGRDNGVERVATPALELEVRKLRTLKAELKRLEVDVATSAQVVQEAMGEAATLVGADGTILTTWKTNGRGNCKYKEALYDLARQDGRTDREIDLLVDKHRGAPARPFLVK